MIKTYKQSNEHELTEWINRAKNVYVKAIIGNKKETVKISKGEVLSALYEVFKNSEAKVRVVHIQDAIYLQ